MIKFIARLAIAITGASPKPSPTPRVGCEECGVPIPARQYWQHVYAHSTLTEIEIRGLEKVFKSPDYLEYVR